MDLVNTVIEIRRSVTIWKICDVYTKLNLRPIIFLRSAIKDEIWSKI
jgi:hypothetical protein